MVVVEAARVGAVPAAPAGEERGRSSSNGCCSDGDIITVLLLQGRSNVELRLIKVKFKLRLTTESSSSLFLFIAKTHMELEVLTFDPLLCALSDKFMHLLRLST